MKEKCVQAFQTYFIFVFIALLTSALNKFVFSFFQLEKLFRENSVSAFEISRVFVVSLKWDLNVVSWGLLPILLIQILSSIFTKSEKWTNLSNLIASYWLAATVFFNSVSWLVLFFYFGYYNDTFNIFFWEFFQNWENSKLATFSLFDELPKLLVLFYFVFAVSLLLSSFYLSKKYFLSWPFFSTSSKGSKNNFLKSLQTAFALVFCFAFLIVCLRSTFGKPLGLQKNKSQISHHPGLNKMNSHPIWDFIYSKSIYFNGDNLKSIGLIKSQFSIEQLEQACKNISAHSQFLNGRCIPKQSLEGKSNVYFSSKNETKSSSTLVANNVVFVLMESFTAWAVDSPWFRENITPGFNILKSEGLYFDGVFAAGGGTVSNLNRTVLQLPGAVDGQFEHNQSVYFKTFETSLPSLFKAHKFRNYFHYAGSLEWHNIGFFMRKLGFDSVLGESSVQALERVRFGVHDGDLFASILENMKTENKKGEMNQFHFVLTLSNHPPYSPPKSFLNTVANFPKNIPGFSGSTNDFSEYQARLSSFRYADASLLKFVRDTVQVPEFKDTVFVFVADHSHKLNFSFPESENWQTSKIPFLVWSQNIKNPQVFDVQGTQTDIGISLMQLLQGKSKFEEFTFGQSLLEESSKMTQRVLSSQNLTCFKEICVQDFAPFALNVVGELGSQVGVRKRLLTPCLAAECKQEQKKIESARSMHEALVGTFVSGKASE